MTIFRYLPVWLLSSNCYLSTFSILLPSRIFQNNAEKKLKAINGEYCFKFKQPTEQHLLRLSEFMIFLIILSNTCCALFTDLVQAFDIVLRESLVYKWFSQGINSVICRLVASFLNRKSFTVSKCDSPVLQKTH